MVLPGARLHMKLWRPWASTWAPQRQRCGMQRSKPSRTPMAILTASSSSLNPQDAIGGAKSQSPLCCEVAARKAARWMGELRLFSTIWRSTWMPGRSQNGCFPGRVSGTVPKEDDQTDRYSWRNELSEQVQPDRISAWSDSVLFYYYYFIIVVNAQSWKVQSSRHEPYQQWWLSGK